MLPFLYLPAALWAARTRVRSAVLVAVLAVEAVALAPLWMSATNTWWLGAWNPSRLAFGSQEYHQNLIALADHVREHDLEKLSVLYPLLHEKELRAYVPGARLAMPGSPPRPSEWVAVSVLLEQYLPAVDRASPETLRGHRNLRQLSRQWTPLWRRVAAGEDHGYVAGTFHLYRLPEP